MNVRWSLALLACAAPARAEVSKIEVLSRAPLLDSKSFGRAGAYEKLVGRVEFAFDPQNPSNTVIVDLERAPQDSQGLVHAAADFMVLRPIDAKKGSGTAFVEISNRGGKSALVTFQRGAPALDPVTPEDFGDGLLMRRGATLMWIGWQFDVPREAGRLRLDAPVASENGLPIEGPVRCDWVVDAPTQRLEVGHRGHVPYAHGVSFEPPDRLTMRDGRDGERREVPAERWHFTDDGSAIEGEFEAGHIYELVYTAQDPVVVGCGLAAVRDFVSYALHAPECAFHVERAVAFGASQSGRFLRHFLWQGFNSDEDGLRVFDAVWIHAAGAGRGSFNHRFAQPSRDAHRFSSFDYPTDLFPFGSRTQRDPWTGQSGGILTACGDRGVLPKVFVTNSGYEYWGRAASLVHTSLDASADVEPLSGERIYHLASGQHYVGAFPPRDEDRLGDARAWRGDPLDYRPTLRALAFAFLDWTEFDREPPPSAYPRIDAASLEDPANLLWPQVPLVRTPWVVHQAERLDFGPGFASGRIDVEPPLRGAAFPALVPQLDEFGNELGGVPTLEVLVPVATYFPWCTRAGLSWAEDELCDFVGTFAPLPLTEAEREAEGDSRPSMESLYESRDRYLDLAKQAARDLVDSRLLLAEDRDLVVQRAADLWDWVQSHAAPDSGR